MGYEETSVVEETPPSYQQIMIDTDESGTYF